MSQLVPPRTRRRAATTPDPARAEPGRIQSVDRAARILSAFGTPDQQVSVTELARMLGVHKSTASRLVGTLVTHGLLERGATDDQLALGPELARLGRLAAGGSDLARAARPVLDELTAGTGEGTTLSRAEGGAVRTIAQRDGDYLVGAQPWVGLETPLHATSDGKVLLAFGATAVPGGALAAATPATIVDHPSLDAELRAIRARGWASSLGEFETGLHGIAAPVFGPDGRCEAALCLWGPSYRLPESSLERLGARCRQAADRISAARGASLPSGPGPA